MIKNGISGNGISFGFETKVLPCSPGWPGPWHPEFQHTRFRSQHRSVSLKDYGRAKADSTPRGKESKPRCSAQGECVSSATWLGCGGGWGGKGTMLRQMAGEKAKARPSSSTLRGESTAEVG